MLLPIIVANFKIIFRDRQALFWALIFPLIFVVVFGLLRLDEPLKTTIAVVDKSNDSVSWSLIEKIRKIELLEPDLNMDEQNARKDIQSGAIDFVLLIPEKLAQSVQDPNPAEPAQLTLLYDESRFENNQLILGVMQQLVDQINMSLQEAVPLVRLESEGIQARTIRYFDFLLPGFIGMGVMIYAIISMSSIVALYRQQKIFKRLLTTPLKVRTFFAGQIIAYLLVSLVQAAIIMAAGVFLFNAHIYGNILWVFVLVLFSNIIFLNLGFLVGTMASRVEAANGFASAIVIPMMFLSGIFFSTENLPGVLHTAVQYLPLTPLLDALRGVVIYAEPFWAYPWEIGILSIWIVVTSVAAVRMFRFN